MDALPFWHLIESKKVSHYCMQTVSGAVVLLSRCRSGPPSAIPWTTKAQSVRRKDPKKSWNDWNWYSTFCFQTAASSAALRVPDRWSGKSHSCRRKLHITSSMFSHNQPSATPRRRSQKSWCSQLAGLLVAELSKGLQWGWRSSIALRSLSLGVRFLRQFRTRKLERIYFRSQVGGA